LNNSKLFNVEDRDIDVLDWYKKDRMYKVSRFTQNWNILTQFERDKVLEY